MNLKVQLKNCIENSVKNSSVIILDPREDEKHLEAIVVSDVFESMSLIERHQVVMNAVKDYFDQGLHALSLKTFTKNQFEKENYGSDIKTN